MQHTDRKSRLFFIEFLIVLFFFLIVSTICLKLFACAHSVTDRADALSHAQAAAASAAELLSVSDGSVEEMAAYFPEASVLENTLVMNYDREFQPCPESDSHYTMTITLSSDDKETATKMIDPVTEKNADIVILDNTEILYSLSVSYHTPLTREEVLQ